MHSVWYKYIYNKIKMKNLPVLLTLYWLSMQIYGIVSLFDGIPSVPSPSHIYNIIEKSEQQHHLNQLESKIVSKLETLHLNDTEDNNKDQNSIPVDSPDRSSPPSQLLGDNKDQAAVPIATDPQRSPEDSLEPRGDALPITENDDPKDELLSEYASIEPTPLADSDFVTEDPSQAGAGAVTEGTDTPKQEAIAVAIDALKPNATAEEHPIPVFSEWAKQMEKAEKREQEQDVANASTNKQKPTDRQGRVSAPKIRAKNYASPDCGAKIIAANQESDNTGHVLSSSKDEYLISICTSRIWFVVELCEPIQAESVELANFELFSSSPKEFSVSVSNRYPTRDWSDVGQFVATDERTIQNFELNPKLFGKYVRVDIHSHYNTEHFCPVSLFRVQGTSEFEAFETADQKVPLDEEDEDEEEVIGQGKDNNNNLFKSASDAVLSMVKKAAQVLTTNSNNNSSDTLGTNEKMEPGGTDEKMKHIGTGENTCRVTLANVVACPGCKETMVRSVTQLLTCKSELMDSLWRWHLVRAMVQKTELCMELMGVQMKRTVGRGQEDDLLNTRDVRRDFVAKLFPEAYLIALCNVAAGQEQRLPKIQGTHKKPTNIKTTQQKQKQLTETVVNNLTIDGPGLMEILPRNVETPFGDKEGQRLIFDPRDVQLDGNSACDVVATDTDDALADRAEDVKTKQQEINDNVTPPVLGVPGEPTEIPTQLDRPPEMNAVDEIKVDEVAETQTQPQQPSSGDSWRVHPQGDTGLEINAADGNNLVQKVHGESVFLRLSNRIKALERNMSLSSQYLEELSRRYKKQVEELQQSFAKTILSFEETTKQTVEEKQALLDENVRLRKDIEQVLDSFIAWRSILFYLVVFVCVQIVLFVLLLLLYIKNRLRDRRRERRREEEETQLRYVEAKGGFVDAKGVRRNSTEGIGGRSRSTTSLLSEGKKRPSEEALQIVGTYEELLIESPPTAPAASTNLGVTLSVGNNNNKKQKQNKTKTRKTSLPNQVYQHQQQPNQTSNNSQGGANPRKPSRTPSETTGGGGGQKQLLMHSNSVNGSYSNSNHSSLNSHNKQTERSPSVTVGARDQAAPIPLEENDEFYLPGSDLSYVEFVGDETESGKGVAAQLKKTSRRLSSPAFLRTALSRSVRSSKKKREVLANNESIEEDVQSTTSNSSWDWYRLRRSSKAAVVGNGSVSLSSQDDSTSALVSPELAIEVEEEEDEEENENEDGETVQETATSPKKTTTTTSSASNKFRKIFRKVF